MDKDGETTRRGLGETDRERELLVRCEKTVFGIADGMIWRGGLGGTRAFTSWNVTSGGAPVPWTDDAVSSYSSQHAGGEVVAFELFSDGVDIFGLRLEKQLTWLEQNSAGTHSP